MRNYDNKTREELLKKIEQLEKKIVGLSKLLIYAESAEDKSQYTEIIEKTNGG